MSIISRVLSIGADNAVKAYRRRVEEINALEEMVKTKTDDELREMVDELREKLKDKPTDGSKDEWKDEYLAYAILRERIRRHDGRRAYDVQMMGAMALYEGKISEEKTGEGKAVLSTTKLPTPSGWKEAGDICVGDLVFGRDGKPTTVTGVYPQGERTVFVVTLKDGRKVECARDHLWSVYHVSKNENLVTHSTEYLSQHGVKAGQAYKWHIPMQDAVEYPAARLPIDPYVMGAFLSDECQNINDKDIAPEYYELLTQTFCHDKWIPEEYKTASIEQRWALVQGLMDTDGNIYDGKDNRFAIQYGTTSPRLRDDLIEILQSLGISATWGYGKRAGQGNAKHDQYVVRPNVDNWMKPKFFRLPSKIEVAETAAAHGSKRRKYNQMAIVSIEETNRKEDMVCFTVDNDEHLFLVGNYVPTHNTVVIFFPAFYQSLHGKQTHVVSVNDYLTQRDAEEAASIMGPLGVSIGRVYNQQSNIEKRTAYKCDIVYGTPSEFGFDYLRDNMVTRAQDRVQKEHSFAIVDEVDSILIDEARTPLIISGAGEEEDAMYIRFARAVLGLQLALDEEHQDGDYFVEEDKRQIFATERGLKKIEERLNFEDLYDRPDTPALVNHLQQALKAEYLFHRDKDYIVIDGEVKIVDEFTGRIMEGRRWSDGLHQAIEAKEGVKIQAENQTMATITLQNYFRLYDKLAGTTGTAATETTEFRETYNLDVVVVPTNMPMIREDADDKIYRTLDAKFEAIVNEIAERHAKGQPMLVGTASVSNSERLSRLLNDRGIMHEVLNAKNHAKEAEIVAQAGRLGAVTIATNMAGRGTDIILGGNVEGLTKQFIKEKFPDYGTPKADDEDAVLPTEADVQEAREKAQKIHDEENPKVIEAGGLCVIGSERHDSRRVDNQLRGRSGRQGDPGYSQFYISLEDDLMRLFGTDRMERISRLMQSSQYPDDIPIQVPMVTKSIESAQRKVEEMNAAMRKNVLDYDDVVNAQRKVIYAERNRILDGENLDSTLENMIDDIVVDTVPSYCPSKNSEDWDVDGLCEWFTELTGSYDTKAIRDICAEEKASAEDVEKYVNEALHSAYDKKKELIGNNEGFVYVERSAMLKVIDTDWVRHLSEMDYLKIGVGLRGMGQRDPLVEYKHDAYLAFKDLVDEMYNEVLRMVLRMRVHVKYVDDNAQANTVIRSIPERITLRKQVTDAKKATEEKAEAEDKAEEKTEDKTEVAEVETPSDESADAEAPAEDTTDEVATDDSEVTDEVVTGDTEATGEVEEGIDEVESETTGEATETVSEAVADEVAEATGEESIAEPTSEVADEDAEAAPEADTVEEPVEDVAEDSDVTETDDTTNEPVVEPKPNKEATEEATIEKAIEELAPDVTGVGTVDKLTGTVKAYGLSNSSRAYTGINLNPYAGVGRNQPCPCGSGKKFKKCHGGPNPPKD